MTPRQSLAALAISLLAGAWASSAHVPTLDVPPHNRTNRPRGVAVTATAATLTGRLGEVGSAGAAASDIVAATTPEPARDAVSVADRLRGYLLRVLGPPGPQNTLYGHILRVSVGLHLASIHTDLSPSERDRVIAEQICAVVSRFRESPEGRHVTALDVDVYGPDDHLLAIYEDLPAQVMARTRSRSARQAGAMTPTPLAETRPTRSVPPGADRPES